MTELKLLAAIFVARRLQSARGNPCRERLERVRFRAIKKRSTAEIAGRTRAAKTGCLETLFLRAEIGAAPRTSSLPVLSAPSFSLKRRSNMGRFDAQCRPSRTTL